MRIVARYITKELVKTFLVITGILLLIVLSNRFVVYLAKTATGELPLWLVLKMVSLYIPEFLSYLIPLGLFSAILLTYGRLYADSEMVVLAACGIGTPYIIKLTLWTALGAMLLTAGLTLGTVPRVAEKREQVLAEGEKWGAMQALVPERFQTFAEGRVVFYIEDVLPGSDHLRKVFIAERPLLYETPDRGWTVMTAEEASVSVGKDKEESYLVLKKGYRYQGIPGTANYTVVSFKEYGREIPASGNVKANDTLRLKASSSLFSSLNSEDAAELQWRLSLPLSVIILALLALPLSKVSPREGRFAKFLPAFVLYILYYNLFTISRRWVASGVLPSMLGVWWVHVLFLLIAMGFIVYPMKRFRRKP